jgi:hypothetical protein
MLHRNLLVLALALRSYAAPQNYAAKEIPAKGDNGKVGGVFGLTEGAKRPSAYNLKIYCNTLAVDRLL